MGLKQPDISSILKEQLRESLMAGFGDRLEGTPCEDAARHPEYVNLLVDYFTSYAGEQGLGMRAEALERRLDEVRELVRILYRSGLQYQPKFREVSGHDSHGQEKLTEEQGRLLEEIMQWNL